VSSIAFSPDGRLLASASNGLENEDTAAEVKVWDLRGRRAVLSLRGHTYGVWRVAFSPDGQLLASAGTDPVVKVRDLPREHDLRALKGHATRVYGVAWSPDGRSIASSSEVEQKDGPHGQVKVWETATGRERLAVRFRTRWRTFAVAFSPDGKRLATGSEYGV